MEELKQPTLENHNEQSGKQNDQNDPPSKKEFGKPQSKLSTGSADNSSRYDIHIDGVGASGSDSSEPELADYSVDSATGMAHNDNGSSRNRRITTGIDGEVIDDSLKPMLFFYLAFQAKVGKRELEQYWVNEGWDAESIRQWFHELHKQWRGVVIGSYGAIAAIFLLARRILDGFSWTAIFSIFGAVAMMMAIASAIYYFRPFNPLPGSNNDEV